MTAASSEPAESLELPRRWLKVIPGLLLVYWGLALQTLAGLASTVVLGLGLIKAHSRPATTPHWEDPAPTTVWLLINAVSLFAGVVTLAGRGRCRDCPQVGEAGRLIGISVVFLIVTNLAALGVMVLATRGLNPRDSLAGLGPMMLGVLLIGLVAVVVGEWAFLGFLIEAGGQVRAGRFPVEVRQVGAVLGLLLGFAVFGGVGLAVALAPAKGQYLLSPGLAESLTARATAAGDFVARLWLTVALGVYTWLVHRAIRALRDAAVRDGAFWRVPLSTVRSPSAANGRDGRWRRV